MAERGGGGETSGVADERTVAEGDSTTAVDSVAETMGVRAEQQAVVAAVLEPTGYLPPNGKFEADGLTLGEVEVVDYSPTADGY